MRTRLLLIFCSLSFLIHAQNMMTKEEAVARFLASNFDVQLAQGQVALSAAGADKAAVGYYPIVTAGGNANFDYGGANQQFQDGREINAEGNLTQVYSGSVGSNYTLYQGGERKARLNQLLQQVELAEVQKRQIMESGLVQVLQVYHQAALAQKQVDLQEKQMAISAEQLEKTRINREFGRGNRADLLTAEANYRRDSTQFFQQQINLEVAKRNLVNLMGESAKEVDFSVDTIIEFNIIPNADVLAETSKQRNAQLALLRQNGNILSYDKAIISAQRRPILGAGVDYQYQLQDFGEGGFFAQQQSNGVGAGINISWNIYDGGRAKNQKEVWQVRQNNQNLQMMQSEVALENQLYNLKVQLDAARTLIGLEEKNVSVSTANLERVQDIYALGGGDLLLVRTAQNGVLASETALWNARFQAKNIEIQLLQLAGSLLDDTTIL